MTNIAVLIPCYNEGITIQKVVRDFQRELPQADIYVYDNNSTDQTAQLAAEAGAIVRKEPRQGKGFVVRQMFFDISADYYLLVDGDDTYPAESAHQILDLLENQHIDMVIGDRLSNGTYTDENKRPLHDFGNQLVRRSINFLYRSQLQDIMTGYRGFSRVFVEAFPIISAGFQIETELSIHALDKRFRIAEVPIPYRDRPEGSESKLSTLKDGWKVLLTIIDLFKDYKPLFFFFLLFCVFFILSLLAGIPVLIEYWQTGFINKMPSAILAVGLMVIALLMMVTGLILDTVVNNARKEYELTLHQIYAKYRPKQ